MSKSNYMLNLIANLLEKGLVNYKDFTNEILNILKSKRDEFIFKMKLTSKEETEIVKKRIEILEKKIAKFEKSKKVKKS